MQLLKWTSIDDRYPSPTKGKITHILTYSPAFGIKMLAFKTKLVKSEWTFLDKITHWMPLPKPPEGKDG